MCVCVCVCVDDTENETEKERDWHGKTHVTVVLVVYMLFQQPYFLTAATLPCVFFMLRVCVVMSVISLNCCTQ